MGRQRGKVSSDDAFGDICQKEIGTILGVLNDPDFPLFWEELRAKCLKIHKGIVTSPNGFRFAPFDASLTQRIDWLKINVLNPVERLRDSLSDTNKPHFRHWEEYGQEIERSRQPLIDSLNSLHQEAESISRWLEGEVSGRIWDARIRHTEEIRYNVVWVAIEAVHTHFPRFPISRGSWDNELSQMTGIIPDYVRRIFLETTGQTEQLDGQIKDAIADFRKPQKKSR